MVYSRKSWGQRQERQKVLTFDIWWDPGKCPSLLRMNSPLSGISTTCLTWLQVEGSRLACWYGSLNLSLRDGAHVCFFFFFFWFSNNEKCGHFLPNSPAPTFYRISRAVIYVSQFTQLNPCSITSLTITRAAFFGKSWSHVEWCWVVRSVTLLCPHPQFTSMCSTFKWFSVIESVIEYVTEQAMNWEWEQFADRRQPEEMVSLFKKVTKTEGSLPLLCGWTFYSIKIYCAKEYTRIRK